MAPAQSPAQPHGATQVYGPGQAALVCPRCAALGAPGMRFCRECGAALNVGAPPQPASPHGARGGAEAGAAGGRGADSGLGGHGAPEGAFDPGAVGAFQRASQPISAHSAFEPAVAAAAPAARLVMLLRDGSEGRSLPLGQGDADIGSREGDIVFADDPYLSPRHARVSCRAGTYTLRDLDSINGVYVRIRDAQELRDRDMVLLGQQVLRFELLLDGELPLGPAWQGGVLVFGTPEVSRFARLVQYTTEGIGRDVHYLFRDETVIGRENGDIVFTDDPFMSRRHAAIRVDHAGRRFTLHDLGSSNGTAIRIRGEHVLRNGDQFRIGRHLFRFEAGPAGGRS